MGYSKQRVMSIATENFAAHLGIELIDAATDKVVAKMPYKRELGVGRIHGGAISALVDIAATAAFWSHPRINEESRGATVGFTINYLKLAVSTDLTATAHVRRRGGTLCTGDVDVVNSEGDEVAIARVTYKLST